jgi:anti-anti-sigma factor
MTIGARIALATDQPPGATVVTVVAPDRRLTTGLEVAFGAGATHLNDELTRLADQSPGPLVLDLTGIDWINSGACSALVRFWKALRVQGRTLALCVSPAVRDTFRVTGLIRLIPCFDELGEAVEGARTATPAEERT